MGGVFGDPKVLFLWGRGIAHKSFAVTKDDRTLGSSEPESKTSDPASASVN